MHEGRMGKQRKKTLLVVWKPCFLSLWLTKSSHNFQQRTLYHQMLCYFSGWKVVNGTWYYLLLSYASLMSYNYLPFVQAPSLWAKCPAFQWIWVYYVRFWFNCDQCTCGVKHQCCIRETTIESAAAEWRYLWSNHQRYWQEIWHCNNKDSP